MALTMLPIKSTSYAPNTALYVIESRNHLTPGTALTNALAALLLDSRQANSYIHSYTIIEDGNRRFDCVLLCVNTANQQKAVVFASVTP